MAEVGAVVGAAAAAGGVVGAAAGADVAAAAGPVVVAAFGAAVCGAAGGLVGAAGAAAGPHAARIDRLTPRQVRRRNALRLHCCFGTLSIVSRFMGTLPGCLAAIHNRWPPRTMPQRRWPAGPPGLSPPRVADSVSTVRYKRRMSKYMRAIEHFAGKRGFVGF